MSGPLGTVLLTAFCCALVGLIILELETPTAEPAGRAAMHREQKILTAEWRFAPPLLRDFSDVLSRPLFSETRRAPSAEASAPVGGAASFRFIGVILSADERLAFVEYGQPTHLARVVVGQELEGWTLDAIHLNRLIFRRGQARLEVKAKDQPSLSPQRRTNTARPRPLQPPPPAAGPGPPAPDQP